MYYYYSRTFVLFREKIEYLFDFCSKSLCPYFVTGKEKSTPKPKGVLKILKISVLKFGRLAEECAFFHSQAVKFETH